MMNPPNSNNIGQACFLTVAALAIWFLPLSARALPTRLVLALDGVAYKDLQALQQGVTVTNHWGRTLVRQAFTADEGYFPVSRMVSTFPSASDVAWTDIFGDRPLPGYQRTYYSTAANALISINGVTTTMEHERQMHWQVQDGFRRAMGYLFPEHTFHYEVKTMVASFWKSPASTYYVYVRASDDAQHLGRDILKLLCQLDQQLQQLRAAYQARTGHDLEIVILSDHGHNHAGRGIRVQDQAFLEKAGYRVTSSITGPKDVVLPVVGIESWVEVHCAPSETETLATRLCRLPGADLIAAAVADNTNRFLVLDAGGDRAWIEWNRAHNSFRYAAETGDPLHYGPVLEKLAGSHELDPDGFASADAWMAATIAHHYPLALERIARGLTRGALNPANILISLDNHYVNDFWLTDKGSRLVTCLSTHGGLDDICSDGILLSNFVQTRDTSTARVAGQFGGFPGVRDFRAVESGAEWVTKSEMALTRIARVPLDREFTQLTSADVYLRLWSPRLATLDEQTPIVAKIQKVPAYSTAPAPKEVVFHQPLAQADSSMDERIYALPADFKLEPQAEYQITGWIQGQSRARALFKFSFHTQANGRPAPF